MARPQSIDEEALIDRLALVFRDVGYEGASLAMLSVATGLQKASLYHRFPRGKQQMAEEVLSSVRARFGEHILAPLKGEGEADERLALVAGRLDAFYSGGRTACLLNMLAAPRGHDGPFTAVIKAAFEALVDAFAALASDGGFAPQEARLRAQRTVMLLHGSLVMARGLGSSEPFRIFLDALPGELLAGADQTDGRPPPAQA